MGGDSGEAVEDEGHECLPPSEPETKRAKRAPHPKGPTDKTIDGVPIEQIPERRYVDRYQSTRWACVGPNPEHLEVLACGKSRSVHLDTERFGPDGVEYYLAIWLAAAWVLEPEEHFLFTPSPKRLKHSLPTALEACPIQVSLSLETSRCEHPSNKKVI